MNHTHILELVRPRCAALLLATTLGACAQPDLVPLKRGEIAAPNGFCTTEPHTANLIVSVKNIGRDNAAASTTVVEFSPGGSATLPTPAIAAGGTVDLPPTPMPGACFDPDCGFTIKVNAVSPISESNKNNNTADGLCIG